MRQSLFHRVLHFHYITLSGSAPMMCDEPNREGAQDLWLSIHLIPETESVITPFFLTAKAGEPIITLSPGGTELGRGTGSQQGCAGSILGGFQAPTWHSPEQPGLSSQLWKTAWTKLFSELQSWPVWVLIVSIPSHHFFFFLWFILVCPVFFSLYLSFHFKWMTLNAKHFLSSFLLDKSKSVKK